MTYEMKKFAVFAMVMIMVLFMAAIVFAPAVMAEAGEAAKAAIISFQTTAMPGISEIVKK